MRVLVVLSAVALAQALFTDLHESIRVDMNATRTTAETKAGVCDCMSWADVYYSGKALCGRANELYFLSKRGFSAAYAATEPISGLPHKVCYDFFKNFLTPSCVNIDLYPFDDDAKDDTHVFQLGNDAKKDKQWCYVSNDCDDLNGGQYGTNQQGFAQGAWHNLESTNYLSWKICKPAVDPMLKYWPLSDLMSIAEYSDVSVSRILRMAYPVVSIRGPEAEYFMDAVNEAPADSTLEDRIAAVPSPGSTWGSRLQEVHSMLGDIVKSGQGTVLDSPGHGDNFHVIQGRAFWEVKRIALGDMAYLGGHFYREFEATCVYGCATGEKRNAVDLTTM